VISVARFTHEHGSLLKYLPRNGVATPAQIINAVQEGTYVDHGRDTRRDFDLKLRRFQHGMELGCVRHFWGMSVSRCLVCPPDRWMVLENETGVCCRREPFDQLDEHRCKHDCRRRTHPRA
jgi:hypothetical protein